MVVASTMPARCGVRGLRALENFRFFELHLPLRERIKRLAHKADPEGSLKSWINSVLTGGL
jgi:hypothetical protein